MLSPQQSRICDRYAIERLGIPGIVLMENAGRGCADRLIAHHANASQKTPAVVVMCGPGNNGGDGFVIARQLWNRGWKVKVIMTIPANQYQGDARIMLAPLLRLPIEVVEDRFNLDTTNDFGQELRRHCLTHVRRQRADWIVDALLGTGAQGPLRSPMDTMVSLANAADALRYAVDIPSGLNSTTGQPGPTTFRADLTGTFIDRKTGFDQPSAQPYLGQVSVIEIGIARHALPFF